jgi:DNA-directed RNA polymerase specialized sigma24 family protein
MPFARKLTDEQRSAVRAWALFGRNLSDVARRLKVSHQTVRRVIAGRKRKARA